MALFLFPRVSDYFSLLTSICISGRYNPIVDINCAELDQTDLELAGNASQDSILAKHIPPSAQTQQINIHASVAYIYQPECKHNRANKGERQLSEPANNDLDAWLSDATINKYLVEKYTNLDTISTYRSDLRAFSRWLVKNNKRLDQIKARDVLAFVDSQKWGNSRKCSACQCVAGFFATFFGPEHAAAFAKKKRHGSRPQRSLTMLQINQVFQHLSENTPIAIRNRAMIGLMLNAAITEREISNLLEQDIDLSRMVVTVPRKGLNPAGLFEAMFSTQTLKDLIAWKNIRKSYAEENSKNLFVSMKGASIGQPLGCVTIREICNQIGNKLGFKFSPQDLRRSFIIISAEHGASIDAIRITGGWSSDAYIKQTLKKYDTRKNSTITPRSILGSG